MEKIIDENYYDLIVPTSIIDIFRSNDNITPINEFYALAHVQKSRPEPCDLGTYAYHFFPTIFTLESDINLEQSGVEQIQSNPNFGLYGRGIMIGVIDTGIDYQHPAFRYQDGSSRILSIWDQTIQDGSAPEGFNYGTEYTQQTINLALKNPSPLTLVPSVDEIGHGTSIASIIAGSRNEEGLARGVVPDADLAIVKLKQAKRKTRSIHFVKDNAICYQESDIMFAIRYLYELAATLKRPLALCIALGSSQGPHEGWTATSIYLSYLMQATKIGIAVSAGNEGNSRRHYYGTIDRNTFFKEFELRVSNKDLLFPMEIWSNSPSRLSINITSPTGESTQEVYPSFNICRRFDLIFESSVIWINNILLEEETGNQLILIRFQTPMEGIWKFRVTNIDRETSNFNSWLPSGNLISDETYFTDSNPNITITSPGNSTFPLTVSAYNPAIGNILPTSSRGYTRNNRIKPDVAAPGFELACAIPNNLYGTMTGTGAAAAFSTGIIAMVLEWAIILGNQTSLTGKDITRLLIRGASRTPSLTYPNNIWGYGTINIQGVFQQLIT